MVVAKTLKCLLSLTYTYNLNTVIIKWDRIPEKRPNACFFKFSNYLIFKEIFRFSISYFLRTKNWTVHHGVVMA